MVDLFARLFTMIAIGGLIGYLTNKIAVRMLFRPLEPKRFLFFKFQGLLPKRKTTIAESMGETIEAAFLSKDDIFDAFMDDATAAVFKDKLKQTLTEKIIIMMPSMIRNIFGENLNQMVSDFIDKEGTAMIHDLFDTIKKEGIERLNIPTLVKEKVDALDFLAFEKLVLDIVKTELKHIELVGLFLGMVIGAVQFLILMFF